MHYVRLLARIIQALRRSDDIVLIDGRARKIEGTEANRFNVVYGAWLAPCVYYRNSLS